MLVAAAHGRFPPADGRVDVVRPDAHGTHAIVEFTGHAVVLTDRSPDDAVFSGVDAFGAIVQPAVVTALAGDRSIGSHDVVMVRRGRGGGEALPVTDRYDDHPRARRAREHRRDVVIHGDDRGLVTIGRGLVDRIELSVEVVNTERSSGVGPQLIAGGLVNVGADELVWAQVAPGNAASLRAFLTCGFVPVAAEVLLTTT
ncbi:MAG: hypothetical protein HKN41_01175 [Ilumatobacter sp.]|nr:hypothetical protein [Ilumatobacter sp.]